MKKINFYGGPGSGKSTVAALLYSELKVLRYRTELVREAAKDLVYQGIDLRQSDLNIQSFIFSEQLRRELLVAPHVDFIVSDSPLFLNTYYAKDPTLLKVAKDNNNKKDLHIWIARDPNEKFANDGRSHNEKQSKEIDRKMIKYLQDVCGVDVLIVKGTAKEKSSFIINHILNNYKRKK